MGMGAGEQPAEVGPPAGVAHEQREAAESPDAASVTVTSAPWMGRRPPRSRAACANSIEPETESRSVRPAPCGRAPGRRPPARRAARRRPERRRRSGSEVEKGMRTHVRMMGGRSHCPRGARRALRGAKHHHRGKGCPGARCSNRAGGEFLRELRVRFATPSATRSQGGLESRVLVVSRGAPPRRGDPRGVTKHARIASEDARARGRRPAPAPPLTPSPR